MVHRHPAGTTKLKDPLIAVGKLSSLPGVMTTWCVNTAGRFEGILSLPLANFYGPSHIPEVSGGT